jgi:hypothetical protein
MARESQGVPWYPGNTFSETLLEKYDYDAFGNMTALEAGSTMQFEDDGVPEPPYTGGSFERWQYDINASLTRHERDGDEGNLEFAETWQYDAGGRVIQHQQYDHQDGWAQPIVIWQFQHDDKGRLAQASYDGDPGSGDHVVGDGLPLSVTTYHYDLEGKLERVELNGGDLGLTAAALGIPDIPYLMLAQTYTVSYQYDNQGNLAADIRDGQNSIYGRYVASRQYDGRGDLIRSEDRLERYGIDQADEISIIEFDYEYDMSGNLIRLGNNDISNNTRQIHSWLYNYDYQGNITRRVFDEFNDGKLEEVGTWQYDSAGYLVWQQVDEGGGPATSTFEYKAAGWSHIFHPVAAGFPAGPGLISP